jgi:hypothetical protein
VPGRRAPFIQVREAKSEGASAVLVMAIRGKFS